MVKDAKTNVERSQPPVPYGNTPNNRRVKRYMALKIVIVVLAVVLPLSFYRPHWVRSYLSLSDYIARVHQDDEVLPALHILDDSDKSSRLKELSMPQRAPCESADMTTGDWTEFNITDEFHFLDNSDPAANEKLHGTISVHRGDDDQVSDVNVKITISYKLSPSNPKLVYHYEPNSIVRLEYTSTECAEVKVTITLRSDVHKKLEVFEVRSDILDLDIGGSLSWTVDNLITHTSHGNTVFNGARFHEPLITHNVSSSSTSGEVFGYYVADANLKLENERGTIGAFLIPRVNSDVAIGLDSIHATTETGRLNFEMAGDWKYWPIQSFTHTTLIASHSGSIRAAIPHGSSTNITSTTGDVSAVLVPFGKDSENDRSEIHTALTRGNMNVRICNTLPDSLKDGKFDSLRNTRSRHEVTTGRLKIRYPYGWYGRVEGQVERGTLELDGSQMAKVERGEGWVKATRGEGESFMETLFKGGMLDVQIGLGT